LGLEELFTIVITKERHLQRFTNKCEHKAKRYRAPSKLSQNKTDRARNQQRSGEKKVLSSSSLFLFSCFGLGLENLGGAGFVLIWPKKIAEEKVLHQKKETKKRLWEVSGMKLCFLLINIVSNKKGIK
jgi:hypothetical protein